MAESYLLNKLHSVEQTFNELTRRLADPSIATNPNELQKVAKARSSLEETVDAYEQWKKTEKELLETKQIVKDAGGDHEMREICLLYTSDAADE